MIFVKHVLFLVFLTASKYFLVPPVRNPLPPLTAINTNTSIRSSQYSPASCNATNYDFTFIYDESDKAFKMHGLWPEQCAECLTCGYPSCCDTKDVSYVFPSDPEQVAFINTRWFNATTQEECLNRRLKSGGDTVSLFEHEFFKHASCTAFRQSTSNFVQQVMRLYDEYYAMRVENQCAGYKQLWLNLDGNFAYNNVTKCI